MSRTSVPLAPAFWKAICLALTTLAWSAFLYAGGTCSLAKPPRGNPYEKTGSPQATAEAAGVVTRSLPSDASRARQGGSLFSNADFSGMKVIPFQLGPKERSRTWDLCFELSESELEAGIFLVGREAFTSDSLEIVREALSRASYVITLNLSRGFKKSGNGRLYLELKKGKPSESLSLPPPMDLRLATAPHCFPFFCTHEGSHVAVSMFRRSVGAPVWERILTESSEWWIPSDAVVIGGRYLLMASQSGVEARYSEPALFAFRVDATSEHCGTCNGTGWLGQGPHRIDIFPDTPSLEVGTNTSGYSEICPYCRGTGTRLRPYPIPEPVHSLEDCPATLE